MAKFVVYEKVSELIYQSVDKATASSGLQTTINLGSGLVAGLAAAVISQPADTMLSKINKTKGLPGEGTTSRLIKIAKELGLRGSFTGLPACLFMVGVSDIPDCPATEFPANFALDTYSRSICNLR
jgi:solute carrier family 25 (mitochondrial phosphate transporter), member 3